VKKWEINKKIQKIEQQSFHGQKLSLVLMGKWIWLGVNFAHRSKGEKRCP